MKQTVQIRKREGELKGAHFNDEVLSQKVYIDGQPIRISDANNEDFDIYIFGILTQMYNIRGLLLNRYNMSFGESDWSDQQSRVDAMNELHLLNLLRRRACKPAIPLLVEEQICAS